MREKYESLSLAVLKDLAKARGMKGISSMKKGELIEAMLAMDEKEKGAEETQEMTQEKTSATEDPGTGARSQERADKPSVDKSVPERT